MNQEHAFGLKAAGRMPGERIAFVANLIAPWRQPFAAPFGWCRAITTYGYASTQRGSCGQFGQQPHSRAQEIASSGIDTVRRHSPETLPNVPARIDACELWQAGIRFDAQRA